MVLHRHESEIAGKTGDGSDYIFVPAASIFMISIIVAALGTLIFHGEIEDHYTNDQDERLIMAGEIFTYIDTRVAEAVDQNATENLSTVMQW